MVFKTALKQLQREMRDEAPGHTKVTEDLESAKDGDIYVGLVFWNPLPTTSVPSSVVVSFAARPPYPLQFFLFFLTPPQN